MPRSPPESIFAKMKLGFDKFGFEEFLESVEVDGFELAKALHPNRGGAQGVGFEFAPDHPAALFPADEPGLGEDAEVF